MDKEWERVREFHRVFNHPIADYPQTLSMDRAQKRYRWMKEEIDEFIEASEKGDIAEQVDAIIDAIYFALGALVEMGVRPDPVFDIVQEANMSKIWHDGLPHYNEDGKVIKPSDWKDPHNRIQAAIAGMKLSCMQDNQRDDGTCVD